MEVTLASAIGMPGISKGTDDSQNVWGSGEQKRLDVAVVEGLDDGGEEVCDGGGRDNAQDEQHLNV